MKAIRVSIFFIQALSCLLLGNCLLASASERKSVIQVTAIEITIKEIYSKEGISWIQEFANSYHIKTKKHVILSLLPMKKGDWVSPLQLREAERLLRKQHYFRDANLRISKQGVLKVNVSEKWTLFPTINFKRTGRQNNSSFGIRESNLLGLGVATTLSYKQEPQKSGYRFRVTTPTSFAEHSYASIVLEDYDVGSRKTLNYDQPFYSSETSNMIFFSANNNNLETTFYQNNQDLGVAATQSDHFELKLGWLKEYKNNTAYRGLVGLSSYANDLIDLSTDELFDLFTVRKKSFLWWGNEKYESEYQVLRNIYVISNKEDINLGTLEHYKIGIGQIEVSPNILDQSNLDATTQANMLKFTYSNTQGLLLNRFLALQWIDFNNEIYSASQLTNYLSLNYRLDLFYPIDNKLSFYSKNQLSYVSQFRETPSAVGGDSGLRGYPTSYQYGKKKWQTNFEARYYSDIDIWDTFAVGWVAFIDVGHAWDSMVFSNIEKGTLGSYGIGVRLFPKIASGRNVLHIDLARPYSKLKEINSWEWRIQVKSTF